MARLIVTVNDVDSTLSAGVIAANQGTGAGTFAAGDDARLALADTAVQPAGLDAGVAAEVADPASATSAALLSTYVAKPALVDDIIWPTVAAHRGAGGLTAPENTPWAYDLASGWPSNIILDGGDWRDSADGSSIDCHDTTVDRTTTSAGDVSTFTAPQFRAMTVDCSQWWADWVPDTRIITLADMQRYMQLHVTTPEPKTAAQASRLASFVALIGAQKSVIVNSFTLAWLAPFAAVGVTNLAMNLAAPPSAADLDAYAAAGVNWLFCNLSIGAGFVPADITSLAADGRFKLFLGCFTRHSEMDTFASVFDKIQIFGSEDPYYTLGHLGSVIPADHPLKPYASLQAFQRSVDPWVVPNYPPGHNGSIGDLIDTTPSSRGRCFDGRWGIHAATGAPLTVVAPWLTPAPRTTETILTVSWMVIFDALGSDTGRWGGLAYSATDARWRLDVPQSYQTGTVAFLRSSGELRVDWLVGGASQGSVGQASTAISAPVTLNQALAASTTYTAAAVAVTALPSALAAGTMLALPGRRFLMLTASALSGATSITASLVDASKASAQLSVAASAGQAMPQAVPLTAVYNTATGSVALTRTDINQTATRTGVTNLGASLVYGHLLRHDNAPASSGLKVSFVVSGKAWS